MSRTKELTVVAIGGHSLLDPGLPSTVENQFAVTAAALAPIADLLERGERLVLTHGNGPQVGFMALRSELAKNRVHEVPLDSLVADSQGSLGYMIQRALREELQGRGVSTGVAAVVTEVRVDSNDQAFREPTKPIGRFYSSEEAEALSAEHGWKMIEDANRGYRRVVPSPIPQQIVQLDVIKSLIDSGVTVICCGGGGIPVTGDPGEHIEGHEAVIDKDRTSMLLAIELGADRLVISTGVDRVYRDFLTDHAEPLATISMAEAIRLGEDGQFPSGSMGPKIEAAIHYLQRVDGEVVICSPENLVAAMNGDAGTRIRRD